MHLLESTTEPDMMLFTAELYIFWVKKSGIPYIFSRYFTKIKVDSYDTFPKEKRLSLHNVIIIIKSILNKDQSHFYHKIFSEKYSYQLDKK